MRPSCHSYCRVAAALLPLLLMLFLLLLLLLLLVQVLQSNRQELHTYFTALAQHLQVRDAVFNTSVDAAT